MTRRRKRIILITAGVVAFVLLASFVARMYVLSKIKDKLETQLMKLRDSGYIVRYDSIEVNTETNEVAIFKLSIRRAVDSTFCSTVDFVSAHHIKATGFRLWPLLLKKKLSFESIQVDSPRIAVHQSFFQKTKKKDKAGSELTIEIDNLLMPGLVFQYLDSSACDASINYHANHYVKDFVLAFYKDRDPYFNISLLKSDSIAITFRDDLYTIKVKESRLDIAMHMFDLDTIEIIPHYGKLAFGRKAGREVDRIEASIPYINMYGFKLLHEDTIAVVASKMTMQFFIKAFRDKRLPFRNPYRPLPSEVLSKLRPGLDIDSVVVNKSYVEYEEFGEQADSSGTVYFDDLYATIKNLNNIRPESSAQLIGEASLMGNGKLHLSANCPLAPDKPADVKGYMEDVDLKGLNDMLEPQLKTRIESGTLNRLDFKFSYNNSSSKGQLALNYNNLKLTAYRNEDRVLKIIHKKQMKGEEVDIDAEKKKKSTLKTLVVNTILGKDRDADVPTEKRTGTISFHRDKHKSIFNYWAKSLLSGVKSAFNIDKLQDSKVKKLLDKKSN
jgi:hypothetical protein